ncbi:hypothetical protein jhhlp_008157 [Lomentospora prolificans]|uniref:Methyltransferase domain-containing protein n=1 Tax=Lomentospora prolificans TaxID=41688 RepID=A0A2N3MZN5_9PEZI|nr:hypothetical protein jhhlp_008157 [Lomentospora prolificans]
MEKDDSLKRARYARLMWNAPLSKQHASELLDRLNLSSATAIVDLGCGWGEVLLQAVSSQSERSLAATGVDTDPIVLARARHNALDRGLDVTFVEQSAKLWHATADRAICIGSSHTLGGTRAMLEQLAVIVPEGRVLIGETCWERTPTEAAAVIFGDETMRLADLVAMCRETGWKVLHVSTADQREWDDFESGHRAGPREWLLENSGDPRAAEVQAEQDRREDEYLTVYRGVLSFAYLVLAR